MFVHKRCNVCSVCDSVVCILGLYEVGIRIMHRCCNHDVLLFCSAVLGLGGCWNPMKALKHERWLLTLQT